MLEVNGVRVLLDFGMFQGPREQSREFNMWLPDNAAGADAVILSHGHLDHCGKLPVLTRAGYRGPIYCTPATAGVTRIVLEDAGEIQEEDAAYLNRRARDPGQKPVEPLYRRADVHEVFRLFRTVPYQQTTQIKGKDGSGLSFTFYDAGHIIGSAYVVVEYEQAGKARKLLFTADVGRYHTPILRDPHPVPGPMDFVITESTYGDKKHAPMEQVEPQFLAAVKSCIDRRSRLLVPAFAVGRTQTVLYYMQKFVHEKSIPPIPIYVDSPMGVEVTHVHKQFRETYDEQTKALIGDEDLFGLARIKLASSSQQSREINADRGPCVIIASSPTCEFGRILHHLKQSVERPDDLVVFVGWTPPGTLGRRLQDGQQRVKIFDRWYDVRCRIETIHGLSAHADGDELLRFLAPTCTPQTRAYVVHGEVDQAEAFGQRLLGAGMGAVAIPATETSDLS
jgi:metallo-beta-lactamase family protein